jgi:MFS family permease
MNITKNDLRRVTIAASIGTFLEYYDLLLSATAAGIIWPSLYFIPASSDPTVGLALSLSTVGIAFIVRPLGGFLFGHIGDKLGRKSTLILTLLLMFIGTLGLGVLPPYSQIGVVSVYLIILLRIIQGIGFGGEWGGAAAWITEFAKKINENSLYWSSFLQGAVLFGIAASTLGFSLVSLLPQSDFYNWGWRLLFIFGAIIIVLGALIRYYTIESPLFQELKSRGELAKSPGVETLKKFWKNIFVLAISWWYMTVTTVLIATPYSIQLANAIKINTLFGLSPQSFMNLVIGIGYISGGLTSIMLGLLYRKIKYSIIKLNIIISILCSILIYLYFYLIMTKNPYIIIISAILFYGIVFFPFGGIAAWFSESFPTQYRYTGTGLAYQFGGLLSGLVASVIVAYIVLQVKLNIQDLWPYYSTVYTIICIISAIFTYIYYKLNKI